MLVLPVFGYLASFSLLENTLVQITKGVILATACIHLLQDSFGALQKGPAKEHFGNIGDYTGLIILVSLLSIFLIEYFCDSYVEHLHSELPQPPSPEKSQESSIERSPHPAFSPSTAVT
ncbi:hypothetical protein AGABI2DRAFT_122269 [Agaricus bisporus var. bisporus H97]|uniref:hypothetical protein n=1 Tax=Agaricus bisporus var. bisporus (strain H97 / ATCC MYA-4626 / FGSC 10389) TaxID=936046 RepID=UPI00029F4F89|nr:hypothetical protein AGABI2DRAFT_122269 [Agaricus bisporus var. bisporus H97]EKV42680.1 hypothetical protein AGABI2DRAFT_122269 [Agaricus bisporus var. bisporus H97]